METFFSAMQTFGRRQMIRIYREEFSVKNDKNCLKDFIRYSSLNVLGMLGLSCYILADTFFISKALGANGLTALNLAIPVYSFIHGSGLMIGIGGGIKYAISKSQENKKAANQAFTTAFLLTALVSSFFFLTGIAGSGWLTGILGADAAVFDMTKTYLRVILLFAPMFMMNNLLLAFVRNDGAPQRSMAAMLIGSFSNIVLDYVFMFPLNMGILGAVLATGLAPVISMLVLSPYFFKGQNQFALKKCPITRHLCLMILSGGLPSLITEVSSGIVIILFNLLILGLEGNVGVAAYGVIANLSLVVISIYTGIAQGIQPLLSQNYGAGNTSNMRSVLRYALITMAAISISVYAFVYLGAEPITAVFNSEQNPLLQEIAVPGLRIYFTGCLFAGFNIILCAYFTSMEFALPAHIISFLRGFIVLIPMAFLLSAIGKIVGIWCTFPATELLVAVIGGICFFLFTKKQKNRGADSSS